MTRRITIIRRSTATVSPLAQPVAPLASRGCEGCRQLADARRFAEERRLEIVRLQQRIAELEDQLRRERSSAQIVRRLQGETDTADPRPVETPSIADIPIASEDQRW